MPILQPPESVLIDRLLFSLSSFVNFQFHPVDTLWLLLLLIPGTGFIAAERAIVQVSKITYINPKS